MIQIYTIMIFNDPRTDRSLRPLRVDALVVRNVTLQDDFLHHSTYWGAIYI